ncbi:MAG TPA: N-acetylmuramoyl-L-alanine amidase [Gemmatimonadales bacterium]|nr:N-acetylmuramoyl-L-alanine amidase [Gemmatimonadales bacterium]
MIAARRAAGIVLLAAACRGGPTGGGPEPCPAPVSTPTPPTPQAALAARSSPFDSAFAAAGAEFRVPPKVLKAIAWVETRWQMVEGREEFAGQAPAFGVMALRGAALERAARLAGVSADRARHDPGANVRAAAALLDAYAAEAAIDRSRMEQWSAVVVRYSGVELPAGRTAYLGAIDRALGLALRAAPAPAACPPEGAPDYPSAAWRPSPNFDQRAADSTGAMHLLIIHTCESNYASCWSWLVNPVSQVSAHYVVSEEGSEVSQLVLERDRAWHIAALYDCTLNRRHDCWLNDVQSNHFTVGVEHAGFVSQDSFPSSQLDASAGLVCDVTRDRGIPRDWQHIVGHGQLQPANRTDPGPNWPWIPYVHRVQARCGEVVVDDSAAYNDGAVAAVAVPAAWPASDSTPDYYGGGYRWAPTAPGATDGAAFSFQLAAPGTRTIDARWTSGTNRSPRATYLVITATGDTLPPVQMDQTVGGGRWHTLGMWAFPAGWSRVVLSRQDASGSVVVADAVRVRQ